MAEINKNELTNELIKKAMACQTAETLKQVAGGRNCYSYGCPFDIDCLTQK